MSGEEDSYVPKSPDLSSFTSAGPTTSKQAPPPFSLDNNNPDYDRTQQSPLQQYHPPPVTQYDPSYITPIIHTDQHYLPAAYDLAPPIEHQPYQQPLHAGEPQPQQDQERYSLPALQDFATPQAHGYTAYPSTSYQSQQPAVQDAPHPSIPGPQLAPWPPVAAPYGVSGPHDSFVKLEPQEMPPRRAAAAAPESPVEEPYVDPSPVRTKFPTARIKRIMQADEEVGKVAQQTPIAVGKALEMFMVQLVSSSAEVAKEKGSKKVSAQMLKQVVETDDQWDFLREIVSRVENEKEGKEGTKIKKADSESEEEEPKKKGRGGRRKKAV